MADVPKLKVLQVVVCDEIRREITGKDFLIGVYSAGVVVPSFPAQLVLSFWIQFSADGVADSLPLEIKLMGDGDLTFVHLQAILRIERIGLGAIGIGPLPVILQIPTALRLQLKQEGGDWVTVQEVAVEKGQGPGITGPTGGMRVMAPSSVVPSVGGRPPT
jgi:hypothetical protein